MSQYVIFTVLSYLMLVPICVTLWRCTLPERIRYTEPLDKYIERTLTADSDFWGLY